MGTGAREQGTGSGQGQRNKEAGASEQEAWGRRSVRLPAAAGAKNRRATTTQHQPHLPRSLHSTRRRAMADWGAVLGCRAEVLHRLRVVSAGGCEWSTASTDCSPQRSAWCVPRPAASTAACLCPHCRSCPFFLLPCPPVMYRQGCGLRHCSCLSINNPIHGN